MNAHAVIHIEFLVHKSVVLSRHYTPIRHTRMPHHIGRSKLQEVQKSPLPGHFPIHLDILDWKMQKNLKKIVVLPLLKSNICVLLWLCSNRLTNTLL